MPWLGAAPHTSLPSWPSAAGSKSKSIIVSFQGDPSEKPKWLQLWCSAVEAANVDPALAEFRHESLADKFNYE